MRKNTASQVIGAQMVSASDGSAFTGSVTAYVTGDAGTQAIGSVGSGACTHEGNGYHTYAPAQAETNYNLIAFTFIGTGAIPATIQVFTTANLVDDVWDEATSGHTTAGTFGKAAADILEDTGTTLDGRIPAALVGGRMDANIGAISADSTAADNAEAFFDGTGYAGTNNVIPTVTDVTTKTGYRLSATGVDDIWDEVLTGATHNVPTSAGRRLRNLAGATIAHDGTAQAGGSTSITLDTGASAINDYYVPGIVAISAGTGAGQFRRITAYDGSTKVATVATAWATNPDSSSEFEIHIWASVRISEVDSGVTVDSNVVQISSDTTAANNLEAILDGTGGVTLVASAITLTTPITANATQISGDATAADNLEAVLDGTGGVTLVASAITLTTPITANATQISGDATAADNLEAALDGTGGVTLDVVLGTNAITATSVATGAIDALALATDAVDEIAAAILSNPANKLVTNASGRVDVYAIGGDTATVTNMIRSFRSIVIDSMGAGSTTTSLNTATLVGTVADQFKGRIITFRDDTATAALRGQQSDITASSAATPTVLTVTALTTAPASGDTFTIN